MSTRVFTYENISFKLKRYKLYNRRYFVPVNNKIACKQQVKK